MKVDNFAVSIQWGGGHHYFLRYFKDRLDAVYFAERKLAAEKVHRKNRKNKGAVPKAHIWWLDLTVT